MSTKIRTAAAILALTTLATACGASGGGSDAGPATTAADATTTVVEETTSTAPPETTTTLPGPDGAIPVTKWADGFCGDFGTWLDAIKSESDGVADKVTPGDIESAKTAIVGLFDAASGQTQTLISSVEGGGVPAIEDGDKLVKDLAGRFKDFDAVITDAGAKARAVSTADPAAFQKEVQTLLTSFQTEVQTVGDSFNELDAKYPSPDLQSALSDSCTAL